MDPTFSSRAELLKRVRLEDRTEMEGPFDLALMEFSVSALDATGKTVEELLALYPSDVRLQVAETLYVKAVLIRDLPTLLAGSSTNPREVWNEEPAARDSSPEQHELLMGKADGLLFAVAQVIKGEDDLSEVSVTIGSDDPCVYKDAFSSVEVTRDLF